jgi:hypothetical protein
VFAPGWLDHHIFDEHYGNDEAFVFALADALREEYRAVVDAGFILQIDDPGVMTSWDMIKPEPSVAEYRRHLKRRIDALNHALAGIPEDRVRHHFCWGSWHGAHTHDLPLKEIIDLVLEVRAQACSFEAAMCVTSTNGRSGTTSSCLPARSSCRAWSATPPTSSSIPSSSRSGFATSPKRSDATMWSRAQIADWARGCTRIWSGRSLRHSPKARGLPRRRSGRGDRAAPAPPRTAYSAVFPSPAPAV